MNDDAVRVEELLLRGTRVITWRVKIKLFIQSLWYPWPLRPFELVDAGEGVLIGGWFHDDGTVYITYIRFVERDDE